MDLVMDAVSATARLLGDPPAGQRGSDSVTKREAIVMVTATATMYFFWPERLWIFKTMFNIALVGWITALAFDAREAGIEAWDGIPAWLKNYLGGGGVAGGNVHVQRSRVPNGKSSGNPAVKQLQQVMKQIRSARLTQDVWGVIRPIIIHCLRTALHYLEPPEEPSHQPAPSKSVNSSTIRQTLPKTPSNQWYGIIVRTPPVHGYGSLGPRTPPWDDMDMDPWHTPEPSTLPWDSKSTTCIPPMTDSLVADTHFSFCIVDKNTWESSGITLSQKLVQGRYWDIRGQVEWQQGDKWSEDDVREILGIQVLGLVETTKGRDVFETCKHHFDALRLGWEYRNISWNDVDFALLLGALATGPKAADRVANLFQIMQDLRLEQFLVPRAQMSAGLVTAVSAMAILGTGGLAAPFVGPMVLGKLGASGTRLSRRDQIIWNERMDTMRRLGDRFPQLRGLLSSLERHGDTTN